MKISILCPDLSTNCLGRSYLLAKILQKNYEVEIIGPLLINNTIWPPLAEDNEISYKFINFKPKFNLNPFKWFNLYKMIDGDIIYSSKPFFSSFGLGLLQKAFKKKYLIIDIDDWDKGFYLYSLKNATLFTFFKRIVYSLIDPFGKGSLFNVWFFEHLFFLADFVTVSNRFLLEKFGGEIIVHGRDSNYFNPDGFSKIELRRELNLPINSRIISFIGTPHPYKGLEDLISAFELVKSKNVFLLIVGLDKNDYSTKIKKIVSKATTNYQIKILGQQSFKALPKYVALSDVIVIPQRDNVATRGQLPAKIFDAMSLEIPIITTSINNTKSILKKNAWYFSPSNISELAMQIDFVLDNYNEAKEMARKARTDFVRNYSLDALEIKIERILKKIELAQKKF